MKVIAVIALFIACASASAVWPYGAWQYGVHGLTAPITQYSTYPAHYVSAPAISYAAHVAAPYVHAPYVHAPVAKVVVPAAASYTAANRGSVHTAPLPGHAVSQTSLNLAPAPGTL